MITVRSAAAADVQQIGAVFDAAVAEEWKYLRELARHPMFPPEEWDRLWLSTRRRMRFWRRLMNRMPSSVSQPFTSRNVKRTCYLFTPITAVGAWGGRCWPLHTTRCGLQTVAKCFSIPMNRTKESWRFTKRLDISATAQSPNRIFEASTCASPGW